MAHAAIPSGQHRMAWIKMKELLSKQVHIVTLVQPATGWCMGMKQMCTLS